MFLHIRRKVILGLAVSLSVFVLGGCLYLQPRTLADIEADIDTLKENGTRVERLNAETDKKVAEVYSHLYVLQAKVYANENEIKALKPRPASVTTPKVPGFFPKVSEPAPVKKTKKPLSWTHKKVTPAPAKISPRGAYKNAYNAYRKGSYQKALSLFTKFVEKYPKHDLADNSQYWVGECYYAMKDYQPALQAFKKVIDKYPTGNKMPDALFKTGYSYLILKDPKNARIFLTRVISDYPFSTAAQNAEIKLKKMKD